MQKRLRVAGCRGMIKDSLLAFAQAWGHIEKGTNVNPNGGVEDAERDPHVSVAQLAVIRRKDDIFRFALSVARAARRPTLPSDPAGAFKAINRTFIDDSSLVDAGGDKVDRVLSAVELGSSRRWTRIKIICAFSCVVVNEPASASGLGRSFPLGTRERCPRKGVRRRATRRP